MRMKYQSQAISKISDNSFTRGSVMKTSILPKYQFINAISKNFGPRQTMENNNNLTNNKQDCQDRYGLIWLQTRT